MFFLYLIFLFFFYTLYPSLVPVLSSVCSLDLREKKIKTNKKKRQPLYFYFFNFLGGGRML